MKNMTDFGKMVETGVDPRLACIHLLFSLLDPFKLATKETADICMQAIKSHDNFLVFSNLFIFKRCVWFIFSS